MYNVRRGGLGAYTGMNLYFAYMYASTPSKHIGKSWVLAYIWIYLGLIQEPGAICITLKFHLYYILESVIQSKYGT